MTLGQRIQELRKQAGLSQEALGEALGVSRQAVSKWESDGGIPELDTLIAMSRFFGITIGELLGVEEPKAEPEEQPARLDEEQVEAILRRYVEETRAPEDNPREKALEPWFRRWGWVPAAAIVMVTVIAVLVAQLSSLRSTVRLLRNEVSTLQVDVSNRMNNLSGTIRNSIYDILEEQSNPIKSFDYEVDGFDLPDEEVTVRLTTVLKACTAETQIQYVVKWEGEDGESGQEVTFWKNAVNDVDFYDSVTIPMNDCTSVSVRIRDGEGLTQEYDIAESIYSLSAESFMLTAYNLRSPIAVTIRGIGFTSTTARSEEVFIDIWSNFPDNIRPVSAVLSVSINEEQVLLEKLGLEESEERGLFKATLQDEYFEVTLVEGDSLEIRLEVTDNLGRVQEFRQSGAVEDGELQNMPMSAPLEPVIQVD